MRKEAWPLFKAKVRVQALCFPIVEIVSGAVVVFVRPSRDLFVPYYRLHCLKLSAESFDKLIPRHLFEQAWRYPIVPLLGQFIFRNSSIIHYHSYFCQSVGAQSNCLNPFLHDAL